MSVEHPKDVQRWMLAGMSDDLCSFVGFDDRLYGSGNFVLEAFEAFKTAVLRILELGHGEAMNWVSGAFGTGGGAFGVDRRRGHQ
jgi:hypothetical protein